MSRTCLIISRVSQCCQRAEIRPRRHAYHCTCAIPPKTVPLISQRVWHGMRRGEENSEHTYFTSTDNQLSFGLGNASIHKLLQSCSFCCSFRNIFCCSQALQAFSSPAEQVHSEWHPAQLQSSLEWRLLPSCRSQYSILFSPRKRMDQGEQSWLHCCCSYPRMLPRRLLSLRLGRNAEEKLEVEHDRSYPTLPK